MLHSGLIADQELGWHDPLTDWIPVSLIISTTPLLEDHRRNESLIAKKSQRRNFRITVGISFLLLVSMLLAAIYQPGPGSFTSDGQTLDLTLMDFINLFCLSLLLVSYIGIMLLKKWGRLLFVIAFSGQTVSGLFTAATVASTLTSFFACLFLVSCGAILALACLTDLFDERLPQAS
jgi:hypothetical protein